VASGAPLRSKKKVRVASGRRESKGLIVLQLGGVREGFLASREKARGSGTKSREEGPLRGGLVTCTQGLRKKDREGEAKTAGAPVGDHVEGTGVGART